MARFITSDGRTGVDEISLSLTGTGRDGHWFRVTRDGYFYADVRNDLPCCRILTTALTSMSSGFRPPADVTGATVLGTGIAREPRSEGSRALRWIQARRATHAHRQSRMSPVRRAMPSTTGGSRQAPPGFGTHGTSLPSGPRTQPA